MNPFVFTEPISDKRFCNREKAIQFIEQHTIENDSSGNVWITGERQVGKTSLMHKLFIKHNANLRNINRYGKESKALFVYTNVQDCRNVDDFFLYLQMELKRALDFKIKPVKDNKENFIHSLNYVHDITNHFVVFLIDEFDACLRHIANSDPDDVSQMMGTINRISEGDITKNGLIKKTVFVFASNHSLTDLAQMDIMPLGSFTLQEYELKWFTIDQTLQLAHHYLIGKEVILSDKEIEEICFEATQGYPYFTQKLLAMMYELKPKYPDPKKFRKIIAAQYAEHIEQIIQSWGGESMPKRTLAGLKRMLSSLKLGENTGSAIGAFLGELAKKIIS